MSCLLSFEVYLLLSEKTVGYKFFFGPLNDTVGMFGMHFAFLEYKMLLHGWIGSKLNLVLVREQLGKADRFNYFGSCILAGGRISEGPIGHC